MKFKYLLHYSLLGCGFFTLNVNQPFLVPNVKNFNKSFEQAKLWVEKTYHEWHWKKLSAAESNAIFKYSYKDYKSINKYLLQTKGLIVNDSKLLTEKINQTFLDYLNQKIMAIDSGLKKTKTSESMIVYRRINENYFNLPNENLRDQNGLIKLDVFNHITNNYLNKEFIHHSYISSSLVNNPLASEFNSWNYPILMKINLPKGTHAGYLSHLAYFRDELEMLIIRGLIIKYHNFSIINENTQQTLKINASIINKAI